MVIPDPEISAQTPSPPREHWAHASSTALFRILVLWLWLLCREIFQPDWTLTRILSFDCVFIIARRRIERDLSWLKESYWESYYFIWCTIFLQMVIKEISYVYIKEICCDKDKWYPISIGKWERREIQEFLDLYFIDILRRY